MAPGLSQQHVSPKPLKTVWCERGDSNLPRGVTPPDPKVAPRRNRNTRKRLEKTDHLIGSFADLPTKAASRPRQILQFRIGKS